MARIKNVVKVMNFHSLIRVDKAKKEAEKYFNVEDELSKLLYEIINNKNLRLDKKILLENPNGMVLNIYIGNDLGFCGNFNQLIQKAIIEDKEAKKIIIGKKTFHIQDENILLKIDKDNFVEECNKIDELISQLINEKKIKEINVVYNRYINISEIVFERKKLFPVEIQEQRKEELNLDIDYVIETDVNELVTSLLSLCICYEIKIYESNSWASENIMRQQVTRESIKKIEEREEEQIKRDRKEKRQKDFKRQIDNYKK